MRPWKAIDRAVQRSRRLALVRDLMITRSAHTPTPEKMFESLWRQKIAYVQRRRGKPPLLVFLKEV